MWSVSDRFLNTIPRSQRRVLTATCTVSGGDEVTLRPSGGTVTCDESSRIRRTGSLDVYGTTADYEMLATPGALIRISHGFDFESVPVFCGELSQGRQRFGLGAGTIVLPLVDRAVRLQRSSFLEPYAPAGGTTRVAAISAIVTAADPTATIVNLSSDAGTVLAGTTYTGSRLDAISQLTADGGTEAFYRADGVFVIRNQSQVTDLPVWTVRGAVNSAERVRPMDKLYNTVVVEPTAGDGSQTWTRQVVQITDTTDPRHPDKIGVVPYWLRSATIGSAAEALTAGRARLARVTGTTETLHLGIISNPALEGGDVIRVVVPQINEEPAAIFQHITDRFTMNLRTGSQDVETRSQGVDA